MVRYGLSRITRRPLDFTTFDLSDLMISIDPRQGLFLYQQVLLKRPKLIFEFGLSHGISALYMAQALEKHSQGTIFSTEIETRKVEIARQHLSTFRLNHRVNILEEDVLTAIDKIDQPIEMVHMDGYPSLNLAVLQKLEPKLTPGALLITDDATLFDLEMRDYTQYLMHSSKYSTLLLKNSTGVLYSIRN